MNTMDDLQQLISDLGDELEREMTRMSSKKPRTKEDVLRSIEALNDIAARLAVLRTRARSTR